MGPDQILFAYIKKSSLKCTWISAADVKSRQHFHAKNNGGIRVNESLVVIFNNQYYSILAVPCKKVP